MFPHSHFLKNYQTELSKIPAEARGKINTIEMERVTDISESEFIREYLNKNRPVVFSGQAANWICCQKWDLKFLENDMRDVSFRAFEDINPHPGELPDYVGDMEMRISSPDLSDAIQNKQAYLRFSTVMDEYKNLIQDLDNVWLKKMRRGMFGVCCQNFIGAKGRKTTLHSGSTPFFYIMAYGEKRWMLTATKNSAALNPELSHHSYFHTNVDLATVNEKDNPGLIGATIYDCHLKEGDILFVPSWMWHQVENLTHSWGVSYNFTALRTFLRYPLFVFVRIFFRKPSFISTLLGTIGNNRLADVPINMPDFFRD